MIRKTPKPVLLSACILAVLGAMVSFSVAAGESLRVVAWAGYAAAEIVAEFEKRFDAYVEVTYVTSDDDLWYKINSAAYDVFAVNTAEHGLANTVAASGDSHRDEKIIWLQALEEPVKRKALWDRIISGDSLEVF